MVLHLLIYTIMNLGLFAFILGASKSYKFKELVYLSELSGFAKRNPVISICLTILLFSMAGVPPLGGFYGKYHLLLALVNSGGILSAVLVLFVNVISTFYYIRIIKYL